MLRIIKKVVEVKLFLITEENWSNKIVLLSILLVIKVKESLILVKYLYTVNILLILHLPKATINRTR